MNKTALKNLFTPAVPPSIIAFVNRRVSPGRYELVTEGSNQVIQADSSLALSPRTRVIVSGGRVVATTGPIRKIKKYEV